MSAYFEEKLVPTGEALQKRVSYSNMALIVAGCDCKD